MSETLSKELARYSKILSPLFTPKEIDAFEYACSLLRVGGSEAAEDPLQESFELFEDLIKLSESLLELPEDRFRNKEKTGWRLALIAYAHLTEMDAPYHLLANLLRVRAGMRYWTFPFSSIKKKPKPNPLKPIPEPSPKAKIDVIKQLALQARLPDVGNAFDEFYLPSLRHSIAHSDYVLHEQEMRMLHGHITEENEPRCFTPVIPFERLSTIVNRTYSFYSGLFPLGKTARLGFRNLKGKCIPYDPHNKGLLEFLIGEQGLLCGFKVHWPNGQESIYTRTERGCRAVNLEWNPDSSINFFVGEYPQPRDPFSPLVPLGGEPHYTPPEGSNDPPRWPSPP